jgi:hypothetical protein
LNIEGARQHPCAAERPITDGKIWRMLSEEDGGYRALISKYGDVLVATMGLFFFTNYYNRLFISQVTLP